MTEFIIEGKQCSVDECRAAVASVMTGSEIDVLVISRSDGFAMELSGNNTGVCVSLRLPDGAVWGTEIYSVASSLKVGPVNEIIEAFLRSDCDMLDKFTWEKISLTDQEVSRSSRRLVIGLMFALPLLFLLGQAVRYFIRNTP